MVRQPLSPCTFPYDVKSAGKNLGNVCFVSMCSFKKDELATTKHQIKANLKEKYASVLKEDPSEHGVAPKIDSPWYVNHFFWEISFLQPSGFALDGGIFLLPWRRPLQANWESSGYQCFVIAR